MKYTDIFSGVALGRLGETHHSMFVHTNISFRSCY